MPIQYTTPEARDTALGTAVAAENALREGMVAYLDDTDEVIKYDGTAWSSVAPASLIVQVVEATDTTLRTTSSTTYVDTNVSLTITPTSASNRILLTAVFNAFSNPGVNRITGGEYQIYNNTAAAAVDGAEKAEYGSQTSSAENQYGYAYFNLSGIDSPATTSAQTYKIRFLATAVTAGTANNQMLNSTTTCVFRAYEVTA